MAERSRRVPGAGRICGCAGRRLIMGALGCAADDAAFAVGHGKRASRAAKRPSVLTCVHTHAHKLLCLRQRLAQDVPCRSSPTRSGSGQLRDW